MVDFDCALKINQDGVEALIHRGSLFLQPRNWQSAVNDLQSAVDLNPYIDEVKDKLTLAVHNLIQSKRELQIAKPAVEKIQMPEATIRNFFGQRRVKFVNFRKP
jgi:lipopolysaccharide biosynthesis regulator YciM